MKVPALMGLCFREVSLGKKRITHTTINNKYYGEKSAGKGDGVSVGRARGLEGRSQFRISWSGKSSVSV